MQQAASLWYYVDCSDHSSFTEAWRYSGSGIVDEVLGISFFEHIVTE